MNEAAAASARRRGHRVVDGRFEVDTELERGSFDLILACHVIEHVDDPERLRAPRLRAAGARRACSSSHTPNWDSADARRFRGHWGGNHFPRHWTLYDEATLRALAQLDRAGDRARRVPAEPDLLGLDLPLVAARALPRPPLARPPVPAGRDLRRLDLRSFVLLSTFTVVDLAVRLDHRQDRQHRRGDAKAGPLEDVDRREDDDPHHVHEVPVDTRDLDAQVILGVGAEVALPGSDVGEREQGEADEHVGAV